MIQKKEECRIGYFFFFVDFMTNEREREKHRRLQLFAEYRIKSVC
jgi:hypothetical protein